MAGAVCVAAATAKVAAAVVRDSERAALHEVLYANSDTAEAVPPLQDPEAHAVTNFGERWLGAFAPVGNTGYSVLVQTRYELVNERSLASLALGTGVVLLLAWTLNRRALRRRGALAAESS
jgi:hypothetical protein